MYTGKAPDGRPITEVVSEDMLVRGYQMQFPTLNEYEIRAVVRDDRFKTDEQREMVMKSTHARRLSDQTGEEQTLVGPDGRPIKPA